MKEFDAIDLGGSGQLIFRQGEEDSLKIKADHNVLPLITATVEGSTLHLAIRDNVSLETHSPIVYTVTAKTLKALRVSGSGSAKLESNSTERLDVRISGSGAVVASGRGLGRPDPKGQCRDDRQGEDERADQEKARHVAPPDCFKIENVINGGECTAGRAVRKWRHRSLIVRQRRRRYL
jgi:hypothetical protein